MGEDCVFCREASGSRATNFGRLYPEIPSRVIAKTESLIAFPCIGQLVKGHFLIVPRQHTCTFSSALLGDRSIEEEFHEISKQAHRTLGESEESSLYFEHGARGSSNGGCGIYHAHVHVLPQAGHLDPQKIFDFKDEMPEPSIERAWNKAFNSDVYVMVGTNQNGFYLRSIQEPLASQTIRKSVAEKLGVAEWDWRKTSREINMLEVLAEANA